MNYGNYEDRMGSDEKSSFDFDDLTIFNYDNETAFFKSAQARVGVVGEPGKYNYIFSPSLFDDAHRFSNKLRSLYNELVSDSDNLFYFDFYESFSKNQYSPSKEEVNMVCEIFKKYIELPLNYELPKIDSFDSLDPWLGQFINFQNRINMNLRYTINRAFFVLTLFHELAHSILTIHEYHFVQLKKIISENSLDDAVDILQSMLEKIYSGLDAQEDENLAMNVLEYSFYLANSLDVSLSDFSADNFFSYSTKNKELLKFYANLLLEITKNKEEIAAEALSDSLAMIYFMELDELSKLDFLDDLKLYVKAKVFSSFNFPYQKAYIEKIISGEDPLEIFLSNYNFRLI